MSAVSWVPVISSVVLAFFFGAVLVSEEKSVPVQQATTSEASDIKVSDNNQGKEAGEYKVPEIKTVQDAVDELNKLLKRAQQVKDEQKKAQILSASKTIMSRVRALKGDQDPAKDVNKKILSALGIQPKDITTLTYDQLMDSLGKKLKDAQAIKAGSGTSQDKIEKIKNLESYLIVSRVKEVEKGNKGKIQAALKLLSSINAIRKDLGDTTIGNKNAQGKGKRGFKKQQTQTQTV